MENSLRVPTCIPDLDDIIKGGLPSGSVVVLFGEVGAGQNEFAYTSAFKICRLKRDPDKWQFLVGRKFPHSVLPERVHYLTLSRSRDEVTSEVKAGFVEELYEPFLSTVEFTDLSSLYFRRSLIPASWTKDTEIFPKKNDGLIETLLERFQECGPGSLVIMDSLTDLSTSSEVSVPDLITFIKGLRVAAKSWCGVVYLLLTKDILERSLEIHLLDSVDGVLSFEWAKHIHSSRRQRYLTIPKFMGVLPHLNQMRVSRFDCMVTSRHGFIVLDTEKI